MLWTFGCSHTQGHGLPDCIDEKGDPIPEVMSEHAWPQQLSNELAEPVTNISFAGIGVRAVWNNILNNYEKFQENDTVIIMWPCWESRIDVIGDPENPNYHACNIIPIRTYDQNQEEYFINYYSKYHMWLDYNLCVQHIWDLLNNKIKLINIAYEDYWQNSENYKKPSWATFEFKDIHFGHTKYCDLPRALDGTHHGEQAHRVFAQDLQDLLFKDNNGGLLLYPDNGM